jgi:quercetin dioxygenase-like cupin family protein
MRKLTFLIIIVAMTTGCNQHSGKGKAGNLESKHDQIFAKGEKITNTNFMGTTWLTMLVETDSINQNSVGSVTFEPGARTNWHIHPNGQIILVLEGEGYYQEKGSAIRILHKGDAVKCPANIPHWHGASADQKFIQIAVTGREKGPTQWLEPVTDEEYHGN